MALLDTGRREWRRRPARRVATTAPTIDALFALVRPVNDNRPTSSAPELNCLVGWLPNHLLRDATARGRDLRIGAERVLIAWGAIDEADYVRRFSRRTGLAIETFAGVTRADIGLPDSDLERAAQYGLFPLRDGNDLIFVVAPRGLAMRRLAILLEHYPDLVARVRLASAADFDAFLLDRAGTILAHQAALGLRDHMPALSAAPRPMYRPRRTQIKRIATRLMLASLLTLPTSFAVGLWSQVLASWFVAAIVLRFVAALTPVRSSPTPPPIRDTELPLYTIIVALYREARSVAPLLRALNALDYPREKLDIILAVETDDLETRAAIARFGAMPHVRVVVAPDIAPRTKPKALNYALPFARGSFIAVFDAEDRPDPGQLRAALHAFADEADDVACVQASLCIDNAADSLFARMFATEYAGHFDIMLPGLAALKMPLPLGGTSNHFRADVLRAIGGWDAWNVTEDADLGLRLARFGYRAVTFASATQEEAPIRFAAWLKQRTRWMKGWMQTWSVHMRQPRQVWRDAGWRGAATLNLIIGANIVSALAYPVLLGGLAFGFASGDRWLIDGLLTPTHFIAISAGLASTTAIGLMGLARRGRLRDGWILLLTPIYWGCLSIATWRALWQLLRDPYRWEKTEHGLTRNLRSKIDKAVSRAQPSTSEARAVLQTRDRYEDCHRYGPGSTEQHSDDARASPMPHRVRDKRRSDTVPTDNASNPSRRRRAGASD